MTTNENIIRELKMENPNRVWEFDEPELTNALNKARADERKRIIKIFDEIWAEEGKNIDNGVYAYPFEAIRDMFKKRILKNQE